MQHKIFHTVPFRLFVIFALVAGVFFIFFFGISENRISAQENANVFGWVWSDNIGWISFNCLNTNSCDLVSYGVNINETTGEASGYAWSDNIGWISFNQSDLSGCPSGACIAELSDSNFVGWAKALSADDAESGGWDGFISLNGSGYGVALVGGTDFTGFAWGSEVVGWVDFSAELGGSGSESVGGVFFGGTGGTNAPSVSLIADPILVSSGSTSMLSWTSTNVETCSALDGTSDWDGNKPTEGSEEVGPIPQTETFTLSCSGNSGSASDSATVWISSDNPDAPIASLNADPQKISQGGTSDLTWDSTNADSCSGSDFNTGGATAGTVSVSPANTYNYTVICSNEFGSAQAQETVTVLAPDLGIVADPKRVRAGEMATISWNADGVENCEISGPSGVISTSLSDLREVSITQKSIFEITCLVDEELGLTKSRSVEVMLVPEFEEF